MRYLVFSAIVAFTQVVAMDPEVASNTKNSARTVCKSKLNAAPAPQCCSLQGDPLPCDYPAGYNAPATIDLKGRNVNMGCCSWQTSFFVDASFIYWFAGEEGLAVCSDGVLSGSGIEFFGLQTNTYYPSFDYKPGFKFRAGFIESRDWSAFAEYTWLRGTNTNSFSPSGIETTAGTAAALTGTSVLVVGDWFLNGTTAGQAFAANSLSSKWSYSVDLLDVCASRPYYQGTHLTIHPFAGLRGAWIRQKMVVYMNQDEGMFGSTLPSLATQPAQPIASRNYSHSWAVGPRFGADVYSLCAGGFRIEGNMAASMLYTRYTKITHAEDRASTAFNPGPYYSSLSDYGCLRPMLECGLGAAWGTYLYCNLFHIDFSASYDFTYMWNQNMMRKLLDDTLAGTGGSGADLYFHGLTVTGRFDF